MVFQSCCASLPRHTVAACSFGMWIESLSALEIHINDFKTCGRNDVLWNLFNNYQKLEKLKEMCMSIGVYFSKWCFISIKNVTEEKKMNLKNLKGQEYKAKSFMITCIFLYLNEMKLLKNM